MIHIRCGFISNSSSTCHIISWAGKKEDLKEILERHTSIFPYYTSYYTEIDRNQIIEFAGKKYVENKLAHISPYAIIDSIVAMIEKAREWCPPGTLSYVPLDTEYDWTLHVSFGDHEGDYCGGILGRIMDTNIIVEDEELGYYTVSNR